MLWTGCLVWSLFGCGELFDRDATLGRGGLDCEECGDSAPSYVSSGWKAGQPLEPNAFLVAPTETRRPTWTREVESAPLLQLAPAVDGLWTLRRDAEKKEWLERRDFEGAVVSEHPVPIPRFLDASPTRSLTVNELFEPTVTYAFSGLAAPDGSDVSPAGVFRLPAHSLQFVSFDLDAIGDLSLCFAAGPGDRTRMFGLLEDKGLALYEFTKQGKVRWTQSNLRVETDPTEKVRSYGNGSWPGEQLVSIADGGVALLSEAEGDTSDSKHPPIISVLTSDGTLRWSATFNGIPPSSNALTATRSGDLVVTEHLIGGEMKLWLIAPDGTAKGAWNAGRAAYWDAVPLKIVSDADDDIYLTLFSGARETPQLTVCRLDTADVRAPVACLAVETAIPSPQVHAMTSPEPGAVVIAYSQAASLGSQERNQSQTITLARIDF